MLVDVTEQVARGDLRFIELWRSDMHEEPERRREPRAFTDFVALLHHPDGDSRVQVSNLSSRGMFLHADRDLAAGSEVGIEWRLPSDGIGVSARGVVKWNRPNGDAGVELLEVERQRRTTTSPS